MWRRACSLSKPWRSSKSQSPRAVFNFVSTTSKTTRPFQRTCSYFLSSQATTSGSVSSIVKKTVKAVRRIATGHKRKEIESDLKRIYSCSFGTKESPAIIESTLDKLLVGCQGGKGKDKHDVKWIWLEKDKPLECPVCTQYFKLQAVGPGLGGSPDAAGKKKTDAKMIHHHSCNNNWLLIDNFDDDFGNLHPVTKKEHLHASNDGYMLDSDDPPDVGSNYLEWLPDVDIGGGGCGGGGCGGGGCGGGGG